MVRIAADFCGAPDRVEGDERHCDSECKPGRIAVRVPGLSKRAVVRRYSERKVVDVDLERISELLRRLKPEQEKVIRLFFGLGCQRPYSAVEIAPVFGVPPR